MDLGIEYVQNANRMPLAQEPKRESAANKSRTA
jgi:hypothetical protein